MKICGTNLVPIFITLVFCGFIFVYFNMRLAEVKSSIEKQNRVLTAFITNVQNDIRSGGMMFGQCAMGSGACVMAESGASIAGSSAGVAGANHLASEEALQAVRRNEKIVVSDDEEDDDDDSDEESDSEDSDDESGSDSEDEEDAKISIIPSAISQDSSVVSLELISDNLTLDFESLPAMTSLDSSSAILNQESLKVVDLDATHTDATHTDATPVDVATSIDITHADAAKTDIIYESMKVDDLRKIVADLNLAVKDEAKKLKKPELLALLKK